MTQIIVGLGIMVLILIVGLLLIAAVGHLYAHLSPRLSPRAKRVIRFILNLVFLGVCVLLILSAAFDIGSDVVK